MRRDHQPLPAQPARTGGGYLIEVGPVIQEPKGTPGQTFTLAAALAEVRGTGDARILRADDLSVAVDRAGSDTQVTYVSRSGARRTVRRRTVRRRLTRAARTAMLAATSAPASFTPGR